MQTLKVQHRDFKELPTTDTSNYTITHHDLTTTATNTSNYTITPQRLRHSNKTNTTTGKDITQITQIDLTKAVACKNSSQIGLISTSSKRLKDFFFLLRKDNNFLDNNDYHLFKHVCISQKIFNCNLSQKTR